MASWCRSQLGVQGPGVGWCQLSYSTPYTVDPDPNLPRLSLRCPHRGRRGPGPLIAHMRPHVLRSEERAGHRAEAEPETTRRTSSGVILSGQTSLGRQQSCHLDPMVFGTDWGAFPVPGRHHKATGWELSWKEPPVRPASPVQRNPRPRVFPSHPSSY